MNSTQNEINNNLNVIKSMIEKTKTNTAESGSIFILWGWLVITASVLTYFFVCKEWFDRIGYIWFLLMGFGVVATILLVNRHVNRKRVKTYSQLALSNLWFACGISFFIIAWIGLPLKVIPFESLYIIMAVIAGVGLFATSGILDWNMLRVSGTLWWVAAIVMMFIHWHFHTLIFALATIPGYLIPGYALNKKYKKNQNA
ncbi:hypothetical protein KKF86_07200 [bacterium]|nr:hypothetical protein [bacterium]